MQKRLMFRSAFVGLIVCLSAEIRLQIADDILRGLLFEHALGPSL
jgi:hypothetical protein